MKLSTHFDSEEFRCRDGSQAKIDPELIRRLEAVRSLAGGRPLVIVSGYRSPSYNRYVGGALHSQHLYGRAADLRSGAVTRSQARAAGFTGIGYCGSWAVHVDVRPAPAVEFPDC